MTNPAEGPRAIGRRLGLTPRVFTAPAADRRRWLHLCRIYDAECLRYRTLGYRYLEIDFDGVAKDPEGAVQRLATLAGIEPSWARMDFAVQFPAASGLCGERGYGE